MRVISCSIDVASVSIPRDAGCMGAIGSGGKLLIRFDKALPPLGPITHARHGKVRAVDPCSITHQENGKRLGGA